MCKQTTLLEKLKNQYPYRLDDLPLLVDLGTEEIALDACTLDQIAIAILTLETEVRPVNRRLSALRELYDQARQRRALGADYLGDIFSAGEVCA